MIRDRHLCVSLPGKICSIFDVKDLRGLSNCSFEYYYLLNLSICADYMYVM